MNPLNVPQTVSIRLSPEVGTPFVWSTTLAPQQRAAINANQVLQGGSQQVNFNTMIEFQFTGTAAMATWSRDYSHVNYPPLTQGCNGVRQ